MSVARNRVGICFLDRPDVDAQIRGARRAEELGYESVWICETRLSVTPSTEPISASVRPSS